MAWDFKYIFQHIYLTIIICHQINVFKEKFHHFLIKILIFFVSCNVFGTNFANFLLNFSKIFLSKNEKKFQVSINLEFYLNMKQIGVQFHMFHEFQLNDCILMHYVSIQEHIVDIFIK